MIPPPPLAPIPDNYAGDGGKDLLLEGEAWASVSVEAGGVLALDVIDHVGGGCVLVGGPRLEPRALPLPGIGCYGSAAIDIESPEILADGLSPTQPLDQVFAQPSVSLPIPTTCALDGLTPALQVAYLDPSCASGIGVTAAVEAVFGGRSRMVTFGSEGYVEIDTKGPAGCHAPITFAGTTYGTVFLNENGYVSFGAGDHDFTPTVVEFASGLPRLAGMWADHAPSQGGVVGVSIDAGGVVFHFDEVPMFGSSSAHSFSIELDRIDGSCTIVGYEPDPGAMLNSLVGLTPGGGATDPTAGTGSSFAGLAGSGLQTGFASDMVYEYAANMAVPGGWSVIHFPHADGSEWIVH